MDDRNLDMWGPGIVLQPDNFGGLADETTDGADRFAERQDAVHRLNVGLAGADTEASELLSIVAQPDDYDFSAEVEKLFRKRRDETLKGFRHPADRGDAIHGFEELTRRYMDRALAMSLDRRVQSRAAGAEQALGRIKAAAVADPDGLFDRLRDADMLLGRMVESGVDADAAALRARQFRGEVGGAVLDELAERDPQGAIARLDNGLFDGLVSAEDKVPLREDFVRIADADTKAEQRRAAFAEQAGRFDAAARRRATVIALASALQSDEADEGVIERAFYNGEIDADDASDLRARLDQFDEERRARGVEMDHLDTAIKSGVAPADDRRWSQHVVDAWWQSERERAVALPELIPDCFGATGFIPGPFVNGVRSRLLSGIPDDAVAAARDFKVIQSRSEETADTILTELPEREAAELEALAHYADVDIPPERVSELAREEAQRRQNHVRLYEPPSRPEPEPGKLSPPTDEPIDRDEMYRMLGYSEKGPGDWDNALDPGRNTAAFALGEHARRTAERMKKSRGLTDGEKAAFRHAFWSYQAAKWLGHDVAKRVGDGHERMPSNFQPNQPGSMLQGLYNNRVGRDLANEPTDGLSDKEVVLRALRAGRLQIRGFNLKNQ